MEMNSTKYLNYMMMHAWKTVPKLGEVTESWTVVCGFLPSSFGAVCIQYHSSSLGCQTCQSEALTNLGKLQL